MADVAQEALDSAKSAHHRIDDLTEEVKDIRQLTAAMARMDAKVDGLDCDVKEIKCDVKAITSRPGQRWEKFTGAIIAALGSGLVAAVLALILK